MQSHRWSVQIQTLILLVSLAVPAIAQSQLPAANAAGGNNVDLYGDALPRRAVLRLGTIRFRQQGQSQGCVAYSTDGKILASTEGNSVILWNAATGERIQRLEPKDARLAHPSPSASGTEITFSPRGGELAARFGDGSIHKWDTTTRQETAVFDPPAVANPGAGFEMAEYRGLTYSPGATMLAMNWNFHTIIIDAQTGKTLQTLGDAEHNTQKGLAWSPDRILLASGANEPPARLWDARSGELVREFHADFKAFALSMAFSPDGKTLAGGCVELQRKQIAICLWDVATGELKAKLESTDPVSLHFTPDGKMLVGATERGEIDLWDLRSKERVRAFKGASGLIRNAALSADGETLALGVTSNEIPQWDLESGKKRHDELVGPSSPVRQTVCSPDGNLIATASENGDVRLWDAWAGKQLKQLKSS